MKIIYTYDDIEKNNVSEKYKNEISDEFISFYESMGIKENLDEFSFKRYGVICIVDSNEEFEDIVINKNFNNKYFNLEFRDVEQWILSNDIIYVVKFISDKDKLIEIFIESNYYIKLDYKIKSKIDNKLRIIRKFDGKKQVLKYK